MKILIAAFLAHFVADFLLQSRDMGKNKSTIFKVLLAHIGIQFAVMFLALSVAKYWEYAICFSVLNSLVHGVIDWYIWRGYKLYAYDKIRATTMRNLGIFDPTAEQMAPYAKDFPYWDDHWFYATIGADQMLHSLTIVLLWGIL